MADTVRATILPKDLFHIEGYTDAREYLCGVEKPRVKTIENDCDRLLTERVYQEWQGLTANQQKRFVMALKWLTKTTCLQCEAYASEKAHIISNYKKWKEHYQRCLTAVIAGALETINKELREFRRPPITIKMPGYHPEEREYTWQEFLHQESRPNCPDKKVNPDELLPRCVSPNVPEKS